ncbi:SDR family oxidoreductase [Streptomyces sp. NPDC002680]|uniref:SDR family oxidoreductase n=1 Tax=Streptomyces sp. NPDC002680 TaxID=3364659 RepID=UPI0036BEBDC2
MILVTGATGNVGGKVLARLRQSGHKVRALTRDPARAGFAPDLDVVAADLGRPETLQGVLDGVDKVFLMALGHNKSTHDANLVAAATKAGVRHIVQLSTLGVQEADEANETPLGRWHRLAEEALQRSGLGWTILRPNGFMTHALGWAGSVRAEGVVRGPAANLAEANIDPQDIADVAVRALTTDGHEGAVHALTGGEALTTPQQVEILGSVLGRELRFEQISLEEHREILAARFSPETADGVVKALKEAIESGDEFRGRTFDGVRQVLGRPPRTFRQWAEDNRGFFV